MQNARLFYKILYLIGVFFTCSGNERLLVDQLRWDFLAMENELWSLALWKNNSGVKEHPSLTLIEKFYNFDFRVQQMPHTHDILYGMEVVRQAPSFLILFSDLRVIHDTYDKFSRYLSDRSSKKIKNSGLQREISTSDIIGDILLDPKNNVNKTVLQLFQQTFGNSDENIIFDVLEIVSDDDYYCKNSQPPQQVIYNLYNAIALAELKGYIMSQFSYLMLRLQEPGNYTELSLLARQQFENRINDSISSLKGIMQIAPGKLWKCDPKYHSRGGTYDELTRLLQGHLQNEVDLNSRHSCKENCGAYPTALSYGCYDSDSEYCKRVKPCLGKILNCRFVESDMKACISPVHSARRYEYIKYKSGKIMGEESLCSNRQVNSWHRWFVHCSYCLCLCDEQGPLSDRYFNLRPVMADVANNRVITGLRIVKLNRIIHLQIQEGKLLPYGYIDNTTLRWVPVDDYKITDAGVRNGKDFLTMDFEKRTMHLDNLVVEQADQVLTGVKFENLGGAIQFQINVRGFNFKNGTLSKDSQYIARNDIKRKIDLDNSDIPTKSPMSVPMWELGRYVDFTHTDFEKDMAQTTIPFFDIQKVSSHPAVPLKGAGIYFKGIPGYGGFVAPSITTYNYDQHLVAEFPRVQEQDDSEELEPLVLVN